MPAKSIKKTSTRNVNKWMKRRDAIISRLETDKSWLERVVTELQDELELGKEQLAQAKDVVQRLESEKQCKEVQGRKMYQAAWYHKKQRERHSSGYTEDDLQSLLNE